MYIFRTYILFVPHKNGVKEVSAMYVLIISKRSVGYHDFLTDVRKWEHTKGSFSAVLGRFP